MWYVAHVMIYTRFKDGNQNKYPVCENMYLVQASTEEEAYAKATALGQEEQGDAGRQPVFRRPGLPHDAAALGEANPFLPPPRGRRASRHVVLVGRLRRQGDAIAAVRERHPVRRLAPDIPAAGNRP